MRGWLVTLAALAGLVGAAGVALAAIGAHHSSNPNVTTAAHFLLFHAPALLALCAIAREPRRLGLLFAGSLIALGVTLFSGDLALRALVRVTPVPMAAPTGGILMILGWLGAAVAVPWALSHRDAEHRGARS